MENVRVQQYFHLKGQKISKRKVKAPEKLRDQNAKYLITDMTTVSA